MSDDDAGQLEKRGQVQKPVDVLIPELGDGEDDACPDHIAAQFALRFLNGLVVPRLQHVKVMVAQRSGQALSTPSPSCMSIHKRGLQADAVYPDETARTLRCIPRILRCVENAFFDLAAVDYRVSTW